MNQLLREISASVLPLLGVLVGALIGYWLSGAREAAKIRREHQRAIRSIQAGYVAHLHADYVERLDAWWPLAIDDYGRFKRWQLTSLRDELRDLKAPKRSWDPNIESEYTTEREQAYSDEMERLHSRSMAIFERLISSL